MDIRIATQAEYEQLAKLDHHISNERSQFLYRKLGYQDCGALLFPHEPLEIVLRKSIASW